MTNIAIEHGPVEIVDLPSWKMVDLSIANCKRLPEGNHHFDAAKMGLQKQTCEDDLPIKRWTGI